LSDALELCLRLQRGCRVRAWGLTAWERGQWRGARARRALMSNTRSCLRREVSFTLSRAGHLPLDGGGARA